jgi:hypothetical protein
MIRIVTFRSEPLEKIQLFVGGETAEMAVHVCECTSGNLIRSVHLPKKTDPEKV